MVLADANGAFCGRVNNDSVFKIATSPIGLNVGIGTHSLTSLNETSASGDRNSAVGLYSLSNIVDGRQNAAIGYDAGGKLANDETPQENVSNSVFLGQGRTEQPRMV
ncbi:hypothetical protein FACS1894188_09130 [Clostridia bacterium]|nr:hypothetical protein FACS1894188_09130 [Clostridia bacterium]